MTKQQKSPWPDEWPAPKKPKARINKRRWLWGGVLIICLLLLPISFLQLRLVNQQDPFAGCFTIVDPTSSWFSGLYLSHALPLAQPGDVLPINVTGGYGVQGNLLTMCGDEFTREANRSEMQLGDERFVEAHLNGRFLVKTACYDPCLIAFAVPADLPAGIYQLTLHSLALDGTLLTEQAFDLTIE